jgi:ankyrin repeat protein
VANQRRPERSLVVTRSSLPTRSLREHPHLDQLRRQAKELLEAFRSGDGDAVTEVHAHYHDADPGAFALHDAQLVLARAYGFDSWPKLKAYAEGATVRRLRDLVRAGDLAGVDALLDARPELASGALLEAVLQRSPAIVRALMTHGAHARSGLYPHRDATSPLTIAIERGYDDIVTIIEQEEQRRQTAHGNVTGRPTVDEVFQAIVSGHGGMARALLEQHPHLVRASHPSLGLTALHVAAKMLDASLIAWLLNHGADLDARARIPLIRAHEHTPLDLAAHFSDAGTAGRFAAAASTLLDRGAAMTARAAVALGEADWLRARHAEGVLVNPIEDSGGLLRIAASHDRPAILALLLDVGMDPNERARFTAVGEDGLAFTAGMPLHHCAGSGKYALAELLLERGADPNADVYASGTPVFQAYSQADRRMVDLLARYGGVPQPSTVGEFRQTTLARQMLAGEQPYSLAGDGSQTLAEHLLWGAACGGDPEIVRMALEHVDWPRDDARWFHVLEQPLRIWTHGVIGPDWDRRTYLTCFRLVLERSDPNLRGRLDEHGFGLTILHSVAGSREHVTAEERQAFATMLLDAGARLDLRDHLLESTPLGWACRWGRPELVALFLERGADAAEADAQPWARPLAWASRKGHAEIERLLRAAGAR